MRSKCYVFKGGDDSKSKMKGISECQTKIIKPEELKIVLDREENINECDNYVLISTNHDMLLQKIRKSTSPISHDKRCYINNIESNLRGRR